MMTYVEMWNT